MRFLNVLLLLLGLSALGCKSQPLGPYVSPRVIGRVVAAGTEQPLAAVKVIRGKAAQQPPAGSTPKGAELLIRKAPALTGADGRFELASERVLTVIRRSSWDQLRLTFLCPGYETLRTNYSTASATNEIAGEPLLDVGDIHLQPLGK